MKLNAYNKHKNCGKHIERDTKAEKAKGYWPKKHWQYVCEKSYQKTAQYTALQSCSTSHTLCVYMIINSPEAAIYLHAGPECSDFSVTIM